MEKTQSNASAKAKWTVMVYMAGDNNLDGAARNEEFEGLFMVVVFALDEPLPLLMVL